MWLFVKVLIGLIFGAAAGFGYSKLTGSMGSS